MSPPASVPETEQEKKWNVAMAPYIRRRKALNDKSQRHFLDDKLGFHMFARNYGIPCPNLMGVYYHGEYMDCFLNPQNEQQLMGASDYFCKWILGIQGTTTYHIGIFNDLKKIPRFKNRTYILEERIQQHPTMSSLNPNSVNTIRMTTVREGTSVAVFEHWMRMSIGNSYVDNSHSGGISIIVKDDGSLETTARQLRTGAQFERHPLTGVKFSDVKIPFWEDAKALALRAHRCLYSMHSVGWDVAITPYGPILLEGNTTWDMRIVPQLSDELPDRYEKYFGKK